MYEYIEYNLSTKLVYSYFGNVLRTNTFQSSDLLLTLILPPFVDRGVVLATVPLVALDVDQCPAPFHVPNAFKNTALCDYQSTYVRSDLIHFAFSKLTYSLNVEPS